MSKKSLIILNILSLTGMITVNTLANTLPINGFNTGQLSALYPNEFVPAGYTFSIWLIIYIFLTGFAIFQAGAWKDERHQTVVERMGILFILTNLLNSAWIYAWHYRQIVLSVLIMICLLSTLIAIHRKLPIPDNTKSFREKLWVQTPFSIYLSWIMTATIANITAFLVSSGWKGGPLTENLWTIVMISIAVILSILLLWTRKNRIIPLVTVWSIAGILTKQRAMNGWNIVVLSAAVACTILVVATITLGYNRPKEARLN